MNNITIPDKTPIIYQLIGKSPPSHEDYTKCQISTSSLALVFGEELKNRDLLIKEEQ